MSQTIIDHTHPLYRKMWQNANVGSRHNGAYYYSIEIVKNIIPKIKTKRNWVTVNIPGHCANDSIVFIHNNRHPENYRWLKRYKNLVLVCGVESTVNKVKDYGEHIIYLPLSIDVEEVRRYRLDEARGVAYVGRKSKARGLPLPPNIDHLSGLPRPKLLAQMARYAHVYAIGRCAIEAKVLGCGVLPFDPRYPNPDVWQVFDNSEAAALLQEKLNEIDGDDDGAD